MLGGLGFGVSVRFGQGVVQVAAPGFQAVRGLRLWFQFLFLLDFFQRFQRALASLWRAESVASTCSTSCLTVDAILWLYAIGG